MKTKKNLLVFSFILIGFTSACDLFPSNTTSNLNGEEASPTQEVILEGAFSDGKAGSDEPVLVTGTVPFTSPFFLNSASEPFVLLEDQAGFVARDLEFEFPLPGQAMGPVWQIDDNTMEYSLSLPAVPQGTLIDLDNDGQEDKGVMVFAVAYWSNIWGGPFLEAREGTGWSGAHATTITDPERDYEISGGHLIIWSPDDQQGFPSGFGEDEMLFTEDDPIQPVPPGYSIVDLNAEPFLVYKEANPEFELIEGSGAVKDYSEMSYAEAFDAMFEKVSVEYPFTEDKNVDWDALYQEFAPRIASAQDDAAFYLALRGFTLSIPDAHISSGFDINYFWDNYGGGIGIAAAELTDGRIIVTLLIPNSPADSAGIEVGAEIITWAGMPASQAVENVSPLFAPFSTKHSEYQAKVTYLTRIPLFSDVTLTYQNPGGDPTEITLHSEQELDSLFASDPIFGEYENPVSLPVEGHTLENGFGYIKIGTFSDDYNLMAQIWEYYIEGLIENDVPGLVIDLRVNFGGSGGLAQAFVGYFFDEEILVSQHAYYNHKLGEFEYTDYPTKIEPGPLYYDGPIVVLVSPNCISACEGFSYWLTINNRATIVGHFGTAGAFGEVGRGQYTMPGDLDMQFPTGRPEKPDGSLLIEGVGVLPDIVVPVTYESALGQVDVLLEKAIEILLESVQ